MNKPISMLFLILGISLIIAGRVKTFHMTEGEALVNCWQYFSGGTVSLFLSYCFINNWEYKK